MKIIIGAALLGLGIFPACAAEDHPAFMTSDQIAIYKCDDKPFAELPVLADRLGVAPGVSENGGAAMVLQMCDGRQYDFIKIINAVLDRMDRVAK